MMMDKEKVFERRNWHHNDIVTADDANRWEEGIETNTNTIQEMMEGALPTTQEVIEARTDIHNVEHKNLKVRLDNHERNGFNITDRQVHSMRTLRIANLGEEINLVKVGEVTATVPRKTGGLIISNVGIGEDSPYPMRFVKVGEVNV